MNIWDYSEFFQFKIPRQYRLTVSNTVSDAEVKETLLDVVSDELGSVYFKREDKNLTGSMKDRGLVYQISAHYAEGKRVFAISSSGNAAVSASKICETVSLKVHVFLSTKAPKEKVDKIKACISVILHVSKRPKSNAIKFAHAEGITLLRGSTDKYGTEGYKTLAFELQKQLPGASDIFIPCSSGTAFVGIYDGYKQMSEGKVVGRDGNVIKIPRFHCVQTTRVNPVARQYDTNYIMTDKSIANAIVDKVCHRMEQIKSVIIETNGTGWVISDQQVITAQEQMKKLGVSYSGSSEGAMGFAALQKARQNGWEIIKPVCLISG